MTERKHAPHSVPSWVPIDVRNYVFHTELGQAIRVLARSQAVHASTIMRQVHKVEQRRDDPLVDRAIKALSDKTVSVRTPSAIEVMQALRKLAVPSAMLAIAIGMEQGVVVHDTATTADEVADGQGGDRATTLAADIAMTLALRGWISAAPAAGRVLRYRITPAGRVALRELMAQSENQARAFAEAPAGYVGPAKQTGTWDDKPVSSRPVTQDTPVMGLSRRRDKEGQPFLNRTMVRAAERLREDFELAHVGQRSDAADDLDWRKLLAQIETSEPIAKASGARGQLSAALMFLGPGLAEVALRCCCLLEGLETTEKRMGWAARSGKVVLRIALHRLVLHYDQTGLLGPRIG